MNLSEVMQKKNGQLIRSDATGKLLVKGRDGLTSLEDGGLLPWSVLSFVGWSLPA
jgi:hypothetical protein